MTRGTIWTALVAAALSAAPLQAQDSISPVRHDTTPTAAAAPAQPTGGSVKPGMSDADVRAAWGEPVAVRRMNDWTFMFFRNGRERAVGTYDVVFLQGAQVVDVIVRSADHLYTGVSSSPEGRTPEYTPPEQPAADTSSGAVTRVRVKPGR